MSYYLPTVLINAVGLSNELARLLTAVNSVTYLIFSALSIPLVEKWGRRGLMLLSTAGQGAAFLVITVLLRYGSPPDGDRKAAEASIVFFFLYYIAFGIGMLGVPWLYPTEINSIAMRTKGAAVSTATNWWATIPVLQLSGANKRRQAHQLRHCGDYSNRDPKPRVEVLDRLYCLQHGLHACHILLLSRNW